MCSALEQIKSEEFLLQFGIIATRDALHTALGRSDTVKQIRTDLGSGVISEVDVDDCVGELLDQFTRGVLFPYDISLAAISVVLETWNSKLSERFVFGLSNLDLCEMPMAIGVAKISAKRLMMQTGNNTISFGFIVGSGCPDASREELLFIEPKESQGGFGVVTNAGARIFLSM